MHGGQPCMAYNMRGQLKLPHGSRRAGEMECETTQGKRTYGFPKVNFLVEFGRNTGVHE